MKSQNPNGRRAAFTLIELLVVILILSVLAAMVLPALGSPSPKSKAAQCMNNLRRLTGAWLMYSSDYSDRMMPPSSFGAGAMDWASSPDTTNTLKLIDPAQTLTASYVRAADLFKCPADIYKSPANLGPRARSISLSSALGGSPTIMNQIPGRTYFAAKKLTELNKPGPAGTFAVLDEHPDSVDDSIFQTYEGLVTANAQWRNLPGSYHNAAVSISFVDGHVMLKRWQDVRTLRPVTYVPWTLTAVPGSVDYTWINDRLPYW